MGPTNVALVNLFRADQALRGAQAKLDAATKNVRIQERRVKDQSEKLRLLQQTQREAQSKSAQFDLDIKTRDARIEKLREQQTNAKNNKEYQAFLIEINTEKVDKSKSEDEMLKSMENVEKLTAEVKDLTAVVEADTAKLSTMQAEINETINKLQAEVDSLKPARDAAAAAVPQKARDAFERIVDHMEGEALAPITKPDRRREEYICGGCHMDLVVDVYNKLHSRDDVVFCPSCRRILYIPDDLPPEVAVKKKKAEKTSKDPNNEKGPRAGKGKNIGAAAPRQQSAAAVLESVKQEEEPATTTSPSDEVPQAPTQTEPEPAQAEADSAAPQTQSPTEPNH